MSEQRVSACMMTVALVLAAWLSVPAFGADSATVDTAPFARVMAKAWSRDKVFTKVRGAFFANNTLYVAGVPRGLAAIDPATGITRWMHVGRYPVDTRPTRLNGTLAFAEGGELVGVDNATGVEKSRTKVRVGIRTPVYPTDEGYWVVTAGDDRVYGVSPTDGRRYWHVTVNDIVVGSAWTAEEPDIAFYMTTTGTLSCVGLRLHDFLWQTPMRKPVCSAPALDYPTIFVGCEDYYLYAFSAKSGRESWKICLSAPVLDKPMVTNGRVYVTTTDKVLHAVDIAQQEELWSLPDSGSILTATPTHVIVRRVIKDLHLISVIDATTGKVVAQATSLKHDFFVADPQSGVFFAVNEEGDVLALGLRSVIEQMADAQSAEKSKKLSQAQSSTPATTVPPKPVANPKSSPAPSATPTTTAKPAGGGQKYYLVH